MDLGSIIQAGNDLLSTFIGNAFNFRLQQKLNRELLSFQHDSNQMNIDLAEMQNRFTKKMWDEENAYNTPLAQARRLRAAGLSPAAAAQAVSGIPASSVQGSGGSALGAPSGVQAPQLDLSGISGSNLIGSMRQWQAYRMEKAQADTAEQTQTSNIQGILTDNDAKKWALATTVQHYKQNEQMYPITLRSAKYHAEADSFLPRLTRLGFKIQKQNLASAKQQYGWTDKLNQAKLEEIVATIKRIFEEAKESRTRQGLNEAQAENVSTDTENKKKIGEGLDSENVEKRVKAALSRFGSPEDVTLQFAGLLASGELKPEQLEEFLKAARSYVESSGRVFDGTPYMRSLFVRTLNPGIGKDLDEALWSHGSLNKLYDYFGGFLRQNVPHPEYSLPPY